MAGAMIYATGPALVTGTAALLICPVSLYLLHLFTELCLVPRGSMTVMGLLTFAFMLIRTRTRWRMGFTRGWHSQTSSTQCSTLSEHYHPLGYATRIVHPQLCWRSWYLLAENLSSPLVHVLNPGIIPFIL